MKKAIIVEDDPADAARIVAWLGLAEGAYELFDPTLHVRTGMGAQQTGFVVAALRDLMREVNPNLVIFDLQLHHNTYDFDGWSLCRLLREHSHPPGPGLVWVTTLPRTMHLDEWSRHGADRGWVKPWSDDADADDHTGAEAEDLESLAAGRPAVLDCMKPEFWTKGAAEF